MLSMESAISEVALTTKERNALQVLGVLTVGDFMQIDLQEVFDLGFGATTYAKLKRTHDRLHDILCPGSRASNDACSPQVDDDIVTLGLTARGLKALRRLKVNTVREFLSLNLAGVGRVRGCGIGTQEHLLKRQAELRICLGSEFSEANPSPDVVAAQLHHDEAARDLVKQPAMLHSWRKLPLFSNRPILGISPLDLHHSYCPETSLERLALSGRVKRAIGEKSIKSLGELLLIPGSELIGQGHLGNGTLAKTQSLVDDFLQHSMDGPRQTDIDVHTPDGFLFSLLQPVISNERDRRVLLERMVLVSDLDLGKDRP